MQMRVNIRKPKAAVWLMNVMAFFMIFSLFITIYQKATAGEYHSRPSADFRERLLVDVTGDDKKPERAGPFDRYRAIWTAVIDGSPLINGTASGPKIPEEPVRDPVAQVLEVTLIVGTSRDSDARCARIKYLKTTSEQKELFCEYFTEEGESLKPPFNDDPYFGRLLRIEPERVVFSWLSEEVELEPRKIGSATYETVMATATSSPLKEYLGRPPEETLLVDENTWALSSKEYREITQNHEELLNEVAVAEIRNPETGKKTVELTAVEEDSLAYRRGFRKGDRLRSINGFPVSTKAGAVKYLEGNPDLGIYVVEVERMGRIVDLSYVCGK